LAVSGQIEPLGLLTEKMSRRSFGKLLGLQTMLASTAILSGCGGGGGSDDATDATNATTPTTSTTPTPSSTDTQPLTRGAFVATISDYFNWAHSSEYIDMYRNPQPTFADVVFGTTPYGKQIETALEADWERIKGKSRLTWAQAKASTRAAWHRVETALPGDFDGDGR